MVTNSTAICQDNKLHVKFVEILAEKLFSKVINILRDENVNVLMSMVFISNIYVTLIYCWRFVNQLNALLFYLIKASLKLEKMFCIQDIDYYIRRILFRKRKIGNTNLKLFVTHHSIVFSLQVVFYSYLGANNLSSLSEQSSGRQPFRFHQLQKPLK